MIDINIIQTYHGFDGHVAAFAPKLSQTLHVLGCLPLFLCVVGARQTPFQTVAGRRRQILSTNCLLYNTWKCRLRYTVDFMIYIIYDEPAGEYHSLPGYLKDNEYVLSCHRSEWPLKQILLSIFTIPSETINVSMHLIGFFLCLALTICITTKGPKVVDLRSLQHLLDLLKKTDLQRIQSELMACLPSLRHLSDLQRLKDALKTSLASMDVLPSLSCWHLLQLLSNCLPLQI
ncbi:unnamed protein product [Musa acuminata subsp. burmannicoides]